MPGCNSSGNGWIDDITAVDGKPAEIIGCTGIAVKYCDGSMNAACDVACMHGGINWTDGCPIGMCIESSCDEGCIMCCCCECDCGGGCWCCWEARGKRCCNCSGWLWLVDVFELCWLLRFDRFSVDKKKYRFRLLFNGKLGDENAYRIILHQCWMSACGWLCDRCCVSCISIVILTPISIAVNRWNRRNSKSTMKTSQTS